MIFIYLFELNELNNLFIRLDLFLAFSLVTLLDLLKYPIDQSTS